MTQAQYPMIENKPTKMVRVITTSPLARIFHQYADLEPFLDNPKEVYETKTKNDFSVMIQGSWASTEFVTNKPYMIDSSLALAYIGVDNTRFSQDNAGTGLVYFDVPEDVEAALDYHKKTGKSLPKDIQSKLEKSMERIEKLSHDRVLAHCKKLYNSLIAGRNRLKEDGKTPAAPNDMELLVAFVLKEEVKKSKSRRAALEKAFEDTAAEIDGASEALL